MDVPRPNCSPLALGFLGCLGHILNLKKYFASSGLCGQMGPCKHSQRGKRQIAFQLETFLNWVGTILIDPIS